MPIYAFKKVSALLLLSCALGVIIVSSVLWSINSLFPNVVLQRNYCQLINYDLAMSKPSAVKWAQMNHTITLLSNAKIESVLTVMAKTEPPYHNVRIGIYLNPYDYLVPKVIEGDLTWSGKLHENETVVLRVVFELNENGKYFIGSKAVSYFGAAEEGLGVMYYLTVEGGKISKVTDERGETPPDTKTKKV